MKDFKPPNPEDIEYQRLMNHPAVVEYMKAMKEIPGLADSMVPTSLHMIIKDYEEQRELERSIDNQFNNLAKNPPPGNARRVTRLRIIIAFVVIAFFFLIIAVALTAPRLLAGVSPYPQGATVALIVTILVALVLTIGTLNGQIHAWQDPHSLAPTNYEWELRTAGGQIATVKILVEIPSSTTPEAVERLKTRIHTILTAFFQHSKNVPTESKMTRTFRRDLLPTLRELRINIFRYHLFEPEIVKRTGGTPIGYRRG